MPREPLSWARGWCGEASGKSLKVCSVLLFTHLDLEELSGRMKLKSYFPTVVTAVLDLFLVMVW